MVFDSSHSAQMPTWNTEVVIPQGLQGKKKEKQKKTINILLYLLYLKVKHKSYEKKKILWPSLDQ